MITKKEFTIGLLLLLTVPFVFGQSKTVEVGFITDNDLYTSLKNDKYYTNGIELFYRCLAKNNNQKINKKINEIRLGQYIYTPANLSSSNIVLNDRPFAGYLFAEALRNTFYQDESVFKVGFQLGIVGEESFAKETQEQFHYLFKFPVVHGWKNQIKNALAIQMHYFYSMKLFSIKNYDYIDFNLQSEANLGTVFTGVSTGFLSRIGLKKLVPLYNSNLHGASVNANPKQKFNELYIYIAPSINYQLYDATIQGSLFNEASPVTNILMPFRFNTEIGLKYGQKNFNLSYAFIYKGKEVKSFINEDYYYGSIQVSYLMD